MLTIGEAAKAVKLTTKTVRYYADIDLVSPTTRSSGGYRLYSSTDLRKLQFVQRARSFGFSLDSCRELLSLYGNQQRTSREVKTITLKHLAEIERQIGELQQLQAELSSLAANCRGDDHAQCPIIESFACATRSADSAKGVETIDGGMSSH